MRQFGYFLQDHDFQSDLTDRIEPTHTERADRARRSGVEDEILRDIPALEFDED